MAISHTTQIFARENVLLMTAVHNQCKAGSVTPLTIVLMLDFFPEIFALIWKLKSSAFDQRLFLKLLAKTFK